MAKLVWEIMLASVSWEMVMLLPLLLLILGLLVPYIAHYYFIENSVQKMYHLHDEINARRIKQKDQAAS